MTNNKYGRLQDNKIVFAPMTLIIDGALHINPNAEHYFSCGWLQVIDEMPEPQKVGVTYIPSGWEYRDDKIYRTYEEVILPAPLPPVIRYSKLKLIVAAKNAGKWDALKQFISNAGYEDEWNACQFLSSDYPQFQTAKDAIIDAGIATKEEIDNILEASIDN